MSVVEETMPIEEANASMAELEERMGEQLKIMQQDLVDITGSIRTDEETSMLKSTVKNM